MKIKTIILFALAYVTFVNHASAQSAIDRWQLNIGVEAGIPTSFPGNAVVPDSKFASGATARLQYNFNKTFAATLTSGYYNFSSKSNGINSANSGIVPVKLGLKSFISDKIYIMGEAGAGFETRYYKHNKLILAPGIGYEKGKWDVGLRYENFSGFADTYGLAGLRLGYSFGK